MIIIFAIVFTAFTFVVFFGAPFLPTLTKHVDDALDLLGLQPGDTLLELGSGDGRLLRAAAKRGIKSVGYELNPLLVMWSRLRNWRYRDLATVKLGNYWQLEWPEVDGIYAFILKRYMKKLDTKITQQYPSKNISLVSFAFKIPNKEIKKEIKGMFLYEYKKLKKS